MHKNCLLHNAGPRYENKSFLILKLTEKKNRSCLLLNNVPVKSKGHPILKMMGLDNSYASLCSCPSHRTPNNKYCSDMQWDRVFDNTLHLFISFSFDPYCMTELFSTCFFFTLSWTGYTSKTHSTNPLCNRTALLVHNSTLGATPSTYGMVCVCECQFDELNTDGAAVRDHLHMSLNLGALSILYPLFITFSSFPFNFFCRQGRHQSEWQVVWSSFRAWWEKERCQHKYPSRIRGGHGAAVATMNLYPLSQAGKHEPISMAENYANPPPHTHTNTPTPPLQTAWSIMSVCCLFLIVCPFLLPNRQIMKTTCHVIQWTYKHLHTKTSLVVKSGSEWAVWGQEGERRSMRRLVDQNIYMWDWVQVWSNTCNRTPSSWNH